MPDAPAITREELRRLAFECGFDVCRVTRPRIEPRFVHRFDEWLSAGREAGMSWMAEPTRVYRRKHPDSMLPGVRSVICVAMRHAPPPYTLEQATGASGRGVIAAYAHGRDYHDVMKRRLKRLARVLDERLGQHDQRVYVDTAPVLEHALAEAAGVGWQGKHSLIIHRRFGSWMLLGELFTTAEIEPDPPASVHCGSCTACMDRCPTNAIVAPFQVDAGRCISYLTIEHKGAIPRHLRAALGNRIFGCDDCQLVCPWNRKLEPLARDALQPEAGRILPEIDGLLRLDEAAFRARFSGTPIRRLGRERFVRNLCVAAGNSGKQALVGPLLDLLEDGSALVRMHAAWALGRLGRGRADILGRIVSAAARESDEEAREDMRQTIEETRKNT